MNLDLVSTARQAVLGIFYAIVNGWEQAYVVGAIFAAVVALLVLREMAAASRGNL